MRQHWLGLVAACALGLGARAETVDTIRVFEHNAVPQPQLPPQPAAGARCVPPAPVGAAHARQWYEVTYAYRGRIFREVIGYPPGKTIELLDSGKPQSVPYDNRK